MNWNFNIALTTKSEFDDAVDAAISDGDSDHQDIGVAKAAMKLLATTINAARIQGSAEGRYSEPHHDELHRDCIGVHIQGTDA